jgi:ribonuclease HII
MLFLHIMLKNSYQDLPNEAGCDEAGRGALAGPVFAAAVILPDGYQNEILNDSKKLSEKIRNELRTEIEQIAVAWAVASVSETEIDEMNILNASILGMHKALKLLNTEPSFVIVDGNRFKPFRQIPHQCFVKGDAKFASIAAASILAKTHRDEYMKKIHQEFPLYNWFNNKGYPTREHKDIINKYGITAYHRKTFNLNEQLKFDFHP